MNKKAIAGQVIIMLFSVIVIVFIILLGISSTRSISSSVNEVNTLRFKTAFLGTLSGMSYMEVKEITMDLDDVSEVCFINDSFSSIGDYRESLINIYQDKEPGKNLLLFNGNILVDAIELGKSVVLTDENGVSQKVLCFPNIMGKMYVKVKNFNTHYAVKKD